MKIGEKIKALRTSKLMTQSELVGTEITRNMLSRIENGSATPSLETVLYIASRLNVSPGYLLAQGEEERIYQKHNEIDGIKKAFLSEDYSICRDMCLRAECTEDDEVRMILAECTLAIAREAFDRGSLRTACEYLDEAVEVCTGTVYRTDFVVAVAQTYFRYMRRISPTLGSNILEEEGACFYPALTDEFCRYAYAMERWEAGQTEADREAEGLTIGKATSPLSLHFEATLAMERGDYASAYTNLREVLFGAVSVPEPVLYFVLRDLEICCRELENFKGAYEYSMDKIELLQKLLT